MFYESHLGVTTHLVLPFLDDITVFL